VYVRVCVREREYDIVCERERVRAQIYVFGVFDFLVAISVLGNE